MKVLLVHSGSCENELKNTRGWLEAEDCEVVIFDLTESGRRVRGEALTDLIAECDAVVFMVDAALPLEEVQVAVLAANALGKKVISVQLDATILAEVFDRYGSSSIPFKHHMIVGAVCGDQFEWIDEHGDRREDQDMEHHKCKKKKNAAA
ncbi:hypothetical protein [Pseudorhodoplanes sp.]|uniref:hypothetical protein n=1 Tax=Pseudorhodoplanes sp. TaxID=1934341 RepID=UPI003D0E72AC